MTEASTPPQASCVCVAWKNHERIAMSDESVDMFTDNFEDVRERNAWLSMMRCRGCGQAWYVAVDTVDDDYYFLRLTDAQVEAIVDRDTWPTDYDTFVNVWPTQPDQQFRARLDWPWKGESL